VAIIGRQELFRALQGQRKCLPEVFDAWNLYVDYFLGRGFGYVREAKFCSVRGLCTKLTGKRYMGFQNVFLNIFIITCIIHSGFIFVTLSQGYYLVFKPFISFVRRCNLHAAPNS
jgi:hypothetical protein